jgi:hypothetical protein
MTNIESTDAQATADYIELTARLGLPDDKQSAVLAWTGENADHLWTDDEIDKLIEIWHADVRRIDRERG